tara:strand:- start:19958 stop:22783 length:2826 start_codon:yes stop_codon:yes gene_type:complete
MKNSIIVKGASEHNLKNIDLTIPRDRLVVITGVSGSGKSSLAFDTIYAEGQRRYVESLSAYARQFLEQMEKPEVEYIEGLSPAISIEQKTTSRNPRSTVGTVTEIYDYLRLLFARVGDVHCYNCNQPISNQTVQQMVDRVLALPKGSKIQVLAPVIRGRKGEYRRELDEFRSKGFVRIRVDGEMRDLSEDIMLDKKKKHDIELVVDRLIIKTSLGNRLADSIELALTMADGLALVNLDKNKDLLFSERFSCGHCDISYPDLEPRLFSFNNPHGACSNCSGLGVKRIMSCDLIVSDASLSIKDGAINPWSRDTAIYYKQMLTSVADHYNFSIETPFNKLSKKHRDIILYGSGSEEIEFYYKKQNRRHYYKGVYEGVIPNLERRYHETGSNNIMEELEDYMRLEPCEVCEGQRLRPEALAITVGGKSIMEVSQYSVKGALQYFSDLKLNNKQIHVARRVLKEIVERLGFLKNVGLEYLTLNRTAGSLSGGEGQRIRLATQVGSSLVGVLYILDEPSIGLHHRDNKRLIETLINLRNLGNTVIVVEHDKEMILQSDHIIDLGPGAGVHGGKVVATGSPAEIIAHPESLTGLYLSGKENIEIPEKRREGNGNYLCIEKANEHNLKNIDVEIPLGTFTCITGVSGSGKSTLLFDILYKSLASHFWKSHHRPGSHKTIKGISHIDKVINIDQNPIGRTPRSNPATYTGVFSMIRDFYAKLPESRKRGYKPGRFSFNVKGGRCEACHGDGIIRIEMHFLPDVYVTCDVCDGKRFNRETLDITYSEKSIADVLDMTIEEAYNFFMNQPKVARILGTLIDVGMEYIKLGQQATTLSGGEAQRVKLSKELSKKSTGRTLYILDEPTTGLHFQDIKKLLDVLNKLVDAGNTIIVIEHNLDVIKTADYIVDLGPDGGDGGGELIAFGSPEMIAEVGDSFTGQALKLEMTPTHG